MYSHQSHEINSIRFKICVMHFNNSMKFHLFWQFGMRVGSILNSWSFVNISTGFFFFFLFFFLSCICRWTICILRIFFKYCSLYKHNNWALEMRLHIYTHSHTKQNWDFEGSHITTICSLFFLFSLRFSFRFVYNNATANNVVQHAIRFLCIHSNTDIHFLILFFFFFCRRRDSSLDLSCVHFGVFYAPYFVFFAF